MSKRFAGIGSRQTPPNVLREMTDFAHNATTKNGYHLTSGGAKGADEAFAVSVPDDKKTIYLPWNNLNGWDIKQYGFCVDIGYEKEPVELLNIAEKYHPNWRACRSYARLLHARNVAIILGLNLDEPVDFVVCWTKDGQASGGTGQGIRIAEGYDIPVHNLYYEDALGTLYAGLANEPEEV